jgi:hypothetical protein
VTRRTRARSSTHRQGERGFVQGLSARRGAVPRRIGLEARHAPDDDWEITFRFAGQPQRDRSLGRPITGINKKGWEYLWVRYADQEDTGSGAIVKRPIAAYVERVYDEAGFAALGI